MRRATFVALACLPLLFLPTAHLAASSRLLVERSVYLMGTRATLVVLAPDRPAGVTQLERMVRSLERTEAELSTWRPESAVSLINRQPVGAPVELAPSLCDLWTDLVRWHGETAGAFDPTVGALVEAWGLRRGGRQPSPGERRRARALTGLGRFEFDRSACRLTRSVDATLDAGAFGKGAALRRLGLELEQTGAGPWLVDLGGQVAVSGTTAAEAWTVALAHPARRAVAARDVALTRGSLATSGVSERSYEVAGRRVGHIVDPRRGMPVHRPGSVTVWHEDALAADILSTALYVMGPAAGLRYAERHGLAVVFLTPAPGEDPAAVATRASRAFRRRFGEVQGVSDARGATSLPRHARTSSSSADPRSR